MLVTRTSVLTGISRTLELNITEEQLAEYEAGKKLIQNAFPHLTAGEREFIMTGVTDDEWDDTFQDEAGQE